MENLMLHSGARIVTLEEAANVPLPEKTDSYTPLSHYDMITTVKTLTEKLVGETGSPSLALHKKGRQLFGIIPVAGDEAGGWQFTVGFRNSYDKSMAAGICFGSRVFVCDNLAFAGEVVILRKHTTHIIKDLQSELCNKLMEASGAREALKSTYTRLLATPVTREAMAETIGVAALNKVLMPTQVSEAIRQINSSEHFKDETAFALYNHGTYALKGNHLHNMLQKSVAWHNLISQRYIKAESNLI